MTKRLGGSLQRLTAKIVVANLLACQNFAWAESDKNIKLANQLMNSLQKKITTSIHENKKKPINTWDKNKLTIQCLDDEHQFQKIQNELVLPWQNSWKSKNLKSFSTILATDFKGQAFSSLNVEKTIDLDGVTQNVYSTKSQQVDETQSIKDISQFLDNFNSIKFAEFVVEKYISLPNSRDTNRSMNHATLFVRFDFRGLNKNSEKLEDRGMLKVIINKIDKKWKLSNLEIISRESLSTSKIFFQEITDSSKVADLVPTYLRREAIRRGGYALALEDYNNENKVGVFVGTVAESILLKGEDNLTFSKVDNPLLNKQTLVKSAAFADLTNSGKEDLVLVRFAPNESQDKEDRSDIQIFKNNNGNFNKREKVVKFSGETAFAMPMALADFNNDGFLDFYIGFPGAKDFTTLSKSAQNKNLMTEGLFYNQKDGTFKDDPVKSFQKMTKAINPTQELSVIFPHSALAVDYNQDGKSDIVVIDDRGNLSPIYNNKGNGTFESSNTKIGIGLQDYGMGVDAADFNGDGKLDFVMSAVNFNTSRRLKESCEINWTVNNTLSAGSNGVRVFEANNDNTFLETTLKNGLSWTGEGAGGIKIFDYNNDGYPDIYLSNGLWTGSESDNSQDLSFYFVAANSLGILEDVLKSELRNNNFVYERVLPNNDFKSLIFHSDSQSAVMDLLSFYRGDINNLKNTNAKSSLSMAGNQPNRLFRNNGDNTFTEIGYLTDVDSIADGYMPATASFKKDGQLDLILRNADPGYDVKQFKGVQIFKNLGVAQNNSITLKLKGTTSNRDAVGALIEGKIGERIYISQVFGNSGTVQSERLVHFGIGKNKKMDSLKIKWPSGKVQFFENIPMGYHSIEESGNQLSQL
jgi:hypothetical protein